MAIGKNKKRISVTLTVEEATWLDKMITIGVFASYTHAYRKLIRLWKEVVGA